jgi:hypothetical protein
MKLKLYFRFCRKAKNCWTSAEGEEGGESMQSTRCLKKDYYDILVFQIEQSFYLKDSQPKF